MIRTAVKEFIPIRTAAVMMASLKKDVSMEREFTNGLMGVGMMVSGRTAFQVVREAWFF
ncbi:MAG TPA: hypothetical protein VMT12_16115 [Syntrophales bacterium]|nr:hypothetical protein [Syntrophales bacterium]